MIRKKQNNETIIHKIVADVRFEMEASSHCERIGGNQKGFGSVNCAKYSILGRKRPRIEFMEHETKIPIENAAIIVESIAQDQTIEYKYFNSKETEKENSVLTI
ncbi:hypothetical protein Acr_05g0015840 [Actinidia rufa]|uniref:Uncharacterized protein n=1 Tax=Actinidia rufa TaxID=165716 RepID=A0A7J0EN68_9ERIC|nr:hypothetical protein Acr_05g0015840 [Actinidia rufa]